jgi:hypothetical protein
MKTLLTVTVITVGLSIVGWQVLADSDDDREHRSWAQWWQPQPGVAPVENADYAAECGSCHMAYAAGLLPARSWRKLMAGLDDHFGDNAELDPATRDSLTDYLVANSADGSPYRRSRKVMRSLSASAAPLRITDLPYFRHEHHEIPLHMVAANAEVGSLSNCSACHRGAERGSFSERDIRIPGFGRWDD